MQPHRTVPRTLTQGQRFAIPLALIMGLAARGNAQYTTGSYEQPWNECAGVQDGICEATGAVYRDGAFFYPKIVWNADSPQAALDAAAVGFNTIIRYRTKTTFGPAYDQAVADTLAFLDDCQVAGLLGMQGYSRDWVIEQAKWERDPSGHIPVITNFTNAIKDHPAFLGLVQPDEATLTYPGFAPALSAAQLRAGYDGVKLAAPDALVFIDNYTEAGGVTWVDYGEFCDAAGTDSYPFFKEPLSSAYFNVPVNWAGLQAQLESDTLPGSACRGVWQFAQAHSGPPFFRTPSKGDMAWQFWTGVTAYQKGAYVAYGWFVSGGLATNPTVRSNQAALFDTVVDPHSTWVANSTRTLAQSDIAITEQSSTGIFSGANPYARWSGFRYKSALYVVLTNANPQLTATGVTVWVPGPSDQTVQVVSRDAGPGTLSFSNGSLNIGSLGPLGYRVFKFSL